MKKLKFPKGIKRLNIPIFPELEGESDRELRKLISDFEIPKNGKIGFKRTISFKKGLEYDLCELYIEKG